MKQQEPTTHRIDLRLDVDAVDQLDALCRDDVRTRPLQIRWLIAREAQRRAGVRTEVPA